MTKKILFLCLIGFSCACLFAQPVAKTYFIGGYSVVRLIDVNYEDEGEDMERKMTQINIAPTIGFFVSGRMAIGMEAGITATVDKNERDTRDQKVSQTVFFVAPFMRYYLTSGKAGIYTKGSIDVGLGNVKYTRDDVTNKGNVTQIYAGISPVGYCYINEKIALEISAGWLGYRYESDEVDGSARKTSTFGFDFGTTGLSLGAIFKL